MESFRPFVDRIVWENKDKELDWEYKQKIIEVLYNECLYDGNVKLLRNYTNSEAEISEMKSRLPDTGIVNTLILRVEDFCKMQNLLENAFDTDIFASDVILL